MRAPGIEAKVAFLQRPEVYPVPATGVSTVETHMSWVFLTDTDAWKLKKPVRNEFLDFSTPDARRRNCQVEVRLNRRLAPDVYRGVVPLTMRPPVGMEIGGNGKPLDWLVQMRRLPSDRMLDRAIVCQTVSVEDARAVGRRLAEFYITARQVPMTGPRYRARLAAEIEANRRELSRTEYALPAGLVDSVCDAQAGFLSRNALMFDGRAEQRRIIEAHGDLRPEHICLEAVPAIIDCLEFNADLRILDSVSELSFLALECERLGAPEIGNAILGACIDETRDRPPEPLMRFYKGHQAALRAKVAIWHLKDHDSTVVGKWVSRAVQYLQVANISTSEPPE